MCYLLDANVLCAGLGLCFMTPYQMLRIKKACFVPGALL
jgi:hypothetical protein